MFLWRAVPKGLLMGQDRVPDRAWKVSDADGNHLSVFRGASISAQAAHQQRTGELAALPKPRPAPIGMLQIRVNEVEDLPIVQDGSYITPGLTVWDDSQSPSIPHGHGYVDHEAIPQDDDLRKAIQSALMARARRHGWAHSIAGAPSGP